MTIEDVKERLLAHKGEFQLRLSGAIRHKTMKDMYEDCCCPLNVLCDARFPNMDMVNMGNFLGLSGSEQRAITQAADFDDRSEMRSFLVSLCDQGG
jgi:hypothetical protein